MHIKIRQSCRQCGSKRLTSILDLGQQMLASSFFFEDYKEFTPTRKVPLELVRCDPQYDENACGLVQLKHTFPSNILYTDYWYASGINKTMRDALNNIAESALNFVDLNSDDIVVDIGCNDGTLLKSFRKLNSSIDLIGFDPAKNFIKSDDEEFLRINDYFNKQSFQLVRGSRKAKIITSIAMFYDLEDPSAFVTEVFDILDENGIWILQMADLPNMLKNSMFDNICHEHLTYYHLAPFELLINKCGLKLVDLEKNSINGSSYRFYIRKASGKTASLDASKRIDKIRFDEFNLALDTLPPYSKFIESIERNRNDLLFFINQEISKGKKVFAYGASTKGNVILQYCGLNSNIIPYIADRNPRKWGAKTLGSNISIISEEEARSLNPDYFLVLPYHFLDEMLIRESNFINKGGKFIVPVPSVKIFP